MLSFSGAKRRCRGHVSRRDVLHAGTLAFGGLTLADMLGVVSGRPHLDRKGRLASPAGCDALHRS